MGDNACDSERVVLYMMELLTARACVCPPNMNI